MTRFILSLSFAFLAFVQPTIAQTISTIDFVKTVDEHEEELRYYYAHNWKVLREIAIEKGYIHSYQLLLTEADSSADFNVMLITVYKDQTQYDKREEHFTEIMENRPDDSLKLLNELKPPAFRKIVFNKTVKTLFSDKK